MKLIFRIMLRIGINTSLVLFFFNLYYFIFIKSHPSPNAIFSAFILPIILILCFAIFTNILMEKKQEVSLGYNMSFLSFTLSLLIDIFLTVIMEPSSRPLEFVTNGVVIVLEIVIILIITIIFWICTYICSARKK